MSTPTTAETEINEYLLPKTGALQSRLCVCVLLCWHDINTWHPLCCDSNCWLVKQGLILMILHNINANASRCTIDATLLHASRQGCWLISVLLGIGTDIQRSYTIQMLMSPLVCCTMESTMFCAPFLHYNHKCVPVAMENTGVTPQYVPHIIVEPVHIQLSFASLYFLHETKFTGKRILTERIS